MNNYLHKFNGEKINSINKNPLSHSLSLSLPLSLRHLPPSSLSLLSLYVLQTHKVAQPKSFCTLWVALKDLFCLRSEGQEPFYATIYVTFPIRAPEDFSLQYQNPEGLIWTHFRVKTIRCDSKFYKIL